MTPWLAEGKVKFIENIVDGLENALNAFIGLLEGKNFGKLAVRVDEESAQSVAICQTASC